MLALAKIIAHFTGNTKKVALVFVIVIVSISYGLFFYFQNNTENNIRNSLFEADKAATDRFNRGSFKACGFDGIDSKYNIAISYPILNKISGEYLGLVGTLIPTMPFFEHYGNIYDIKSQYLAVLDRNSVELTSSNKLLYWKAFLRKSYTRSYRTQQNHK